MSQRSKAVAIIFVVCVLVVYFYGRSRSHMEIAEPPARPDSSAVPSLRAQSATQEAQEVAIESDPEPEPTFRLFDIGRGSILTPTKRVGNSGDASIKGIVVDAAGKPLSDMVIGNGGDLLVSPIPPMKTDTDGTFRFDGLMPGVYKLMAYPAISGGLGFDTGLQKFTLNPGESITDVRLVYEGVGERTISGRVTNTGGEPIAGARLDGRSGTSSLAFMTYTESDGDGYFVLESRLGERCDVFVRHPAYSGAHLFNIKAGKNALKVVLQGRGTIVGMVVDGRTGKPVTSFEVGTSGRGATSLIVSASNSVAFDDEEGRFTLPSVEVDEATLFVRAKGYAPALIPLPQLRGDEVTDLSVIRLEPGSSLEGTVVDMDGRPVSHARIFLGGAGDASMLPQPLTAPRFNGEEYHATSDKAGHFAIDSLSPQLTAITLLHPDHPKTVHPLSLSIGKKTIIQLVMTGYATVEGTVYVNGEIAVGQTVYIRMDESASTQLAKSDETDDNGFYRIVEVPGGVVTVVASTQLDGTWRSTEIEASTALGHTTVVDVDAEYGSATIEGLITCDGEPVAGASVGARNIDGDDLASTSTSQDGTYQIAGLYGGEYVVVAVDGISDKHKHVGAARVTVEAGETMVVDIECESP